MTRMCQDSFCYNKATYKVKITLNAMDPENVIHRLYYMCDKCVHGLNPDNKRMIYDLTDQELAEKTNIEGKELFGDRFIQHKQKDVIVKFRRFRK